MPLVEVHPALGDPLERVVLLERRRSDLGRAEDLQTEAELAVKEKEGMPTGLVVFHPLTGEPIDAK